MASYTQTLQDIALNMMRQSEFLDFMETDIDRVMNFLRVRLFDFSYPVVDGINRQTFEIMIISHFYMREIGFESYNLFKHFLRLELNVNFSKWNSLYNGLLADYEIRNKRDLFTDSNSDASVSSTGADTSTNNTNAQGRHIFSDIPDDRLSITNTQNMIDYASTLNEDLNQTSSQNNSNSNAQSNSSATGSTHEYGTPDNDDNIQYEKFLNVYQNFYDIVFKDLNPLFMSIY